MAGQFHLEQGAFDRPLPSRTLLAASDAATTLTAAQCISSIITMTPSTGRAITTETAANIIAAFDEYRVGSIFEVTIVNLQPTTQAITFTAGSGVTITGSATVAAATSATFIGRVASSSSVVYYRK
jgi:hypothetical protein